VLLDITEDPGSLNLAAKFSQRAIEFFVVA